MTNERGFTLVESLVALVVFLFGVALAMQLLVETSLALRDGYARDLETPLGAVRARLRADLEAARGATCRHDESGSAIGFRAFGHPTGTIVYELADATLWRFLEEAPDGRVKILGGVSSFSCASSGALVGVELGGRRRALRKTPLAGDPESLRPTTEPWLETLWVAPRGGGREGGW